MSSSTDQTANPAPSRRAPSTWWLAIGLVLLVGAVLVGLNLLDPLLVRVNGEQFEALVEGGAVLEIRVRGSTVEGVLTRPVRLVSEREAVSAVQIEWGGEPGQGEISRWEQGGARVVMLPGSPRRDGPWAAAVAFLLAGGVWHLVAQARRHRRSGSPRERLKEAERQFRAGELTQEQYDHLVAELTIEM